MYSLAFVSDNFDFLVLFKCRVVLKPNSEHLVKEKVLEIDCVVGKASSSTTQGAIDSKSKK